MSDKAAEFAFFSLFGGGAFIFLFSLASMHFRRLKYRKIAEELQAEYQSQGLFKTGEITGFSNGRKYTITTKYISRPRSSNWTTISIQCANKGIRLQMKGNFFKTFPNWKYAFAIDWQNAPAPLEEKYELQVQGLLQEIARLQSDLLKKGYMKILRDYISFTTQGVLKSAEAASQTLSVLTNVTDSIESTPIV